MNSKKRCTANLFKSEKTEAIVASIIINLKIRKNEKKY